MSRKQLGPAAAAGTETLTRASGIPRGEEHAYDVPGAVRMSMDRRYLNQGAIAITSGRAYAVAVYYEAGEVVSSLSWAIGTTAGASLTHTWVALADASLTVVAVSNDDTTTTRTASSVYTRALASAYTIPTSGLYHHVFLVAGTTPNTLAGSSGVNTAIITSVGSLVSGLSTSGLTTPSTVGTTLAALAALSGFALTWST